MASSPKRELESLLNPTSEHDKEDLKSNFVGFSIRHENQVKQTRSIQIDCSPPIWPTSSLTPYNKNLSLYLSSRVSLSQARMQFDSWYKRMTSEKGGSILYQTRTKNTHCHFVQRDSLGFNRREMVSWTILKVRCDHLEGTSRKRNKRPLSSSSATLLHYQILTTITGILVSDFALHINKKQPWIIKNVNTIYIPYLFNYHIEF